MSYRICDLEASKVNIVLGEQSCIRELGFVPERHFTHEKEIWKRQKRLWRLISRGRVLKLGDKFNHSAVKFYCRDAYVLWEFGRHCQQISLFTAAETLL